MNDPRAPAVTFILLTYNQEELVRDALDGALGQDYANLEIIISDDCSTDGTYQIIEQVLAGYRGGHKPRVRRTAHNLGFIAHLTEAVREASSELIVLAAGDDVSLPHRTQVLAERWQELGPAPIVLYSDYIPIDRRSRTLTSVAEELFRGEHRIDRMAAGIIQVHGGTTAVTRSLFREFPDIIPTATHEDRILPFRALLLGGKVAYVDEKLVRYRVEGGISRGELPPGERWLQEYTLRITQRHLGDAVQRLADATAKRPHDHGLVSACTATVSDHLCLIDFAQARPWEYELLFGRHLFSGARPKATFKNYVRYRLGFLYPARRRRLERKWRRDVVG